MVGRKQNGQFDKGNNLARNGGRKPNKHEQEVRAALKKAIPPDEVLGYLADAVKRRQGWAIALYLAYFYGKPIERQEITGADGGALIVEYVNDWRGSAGTIEDQTAISASRPADSPQSGA